MRKASNSLLEGMIEINLIALKNGASRRKPVVATGMREGALTVPACEKRSPQERTVQASTQGGLLWACLILWKR